MSYVAKKLNLGDGIMTSSGLKPALQTGGFGQHNVLYVVFSIVGEIL